MGRQKLESRTSEETGNDSPYLEHITHQTLEKYHLKLEIMLKLENLQASTTHLQITITHQGAQLTTTHFQGKLQDQGPL
jgi:hypothetical protein